jgi:hypothetical protein
VAGDDTVLVVTAGDVGGAVIATRLSELAGINGTDTTSTDVHSTGIGMAQEMNGAQ